MIVSKSYQTYVEGYEDFLSLNTSLAWSFSFRIALFSGGHLSLNFLHWGGKEPNLSEFTNYFIVFLPSWATNIREKSLALIETIAYA